MRIYNIVNLDFGGDRLKEFCINNFNSISASIKSIIGQVRVNVKNITAIGDGLNELASKAVVTDDNGNIAYGGAIIPSDVDVGTTYSFNGVNCDCVFSSNTKASCLGCYLTDTTNDYRATISGNISILVQSVGGTYDYYLKSGAVSGTKYNISGFTFTNIV